MSEHTKTPFEVVETYGEMIDSDFQALIGNRAGAIAWVCDERYARHIVHCVNNHEKLVDQLKDCLELMEDSERRYEQGQDAPNMNDEIKYTRELLAALEAEKGGEL